CSFCSGILSSNAFVCKGKTYKTCNHYRILKANNKTAKQNELVGNPNIESTIKLIFFQEISEYITNAIDNLEYNAELSLSFHVQLDENTLNNIKTDIRIMTKLIIDKIEEENSYN
ncbi:15954_t:CDS:1, partial [Cetraspora pellucida]